MEGSSLLAIMDDFIFNHLGDDNTLAVKGIGESMHACRIALICLVPSPSTIIIMSPGLGGAH